MENTSPTPAGQAETPLHPELAEAIGGLEQRIAQVRAMGPSLEIALELEKRFPDFYMSRNVDTYNPEVDVRFKFKTTAEAAEVLRYLTSEKGLRQRVQPVPVPESRSIIWRFPGLYVSGWFSSSDADACKFVQVGTKEVPVYELRCGDAPAEPLLPAPAEVAVEEGMPF